MQARRRTVKPSGQAANEHFAFDDPHFGLLSSILLLTIRISDCCPAFCFCSLAFAIAVQHFVFARQHLRLLFSILLLLISICDLLPSILLLLISICDLLPSISLLLIAFAIS